MRAVMDVSLALAIQEVRRGRGSRIRTCDLKYPKLPRYQAAPYPGAARPFDTRFGFGQQGVRSARPRPALRASASGPPRRPAPAAERLNRYPRNSMAAEDRMRD